MGSALAGHRFDCYNVKEVNEFGFSYMFSVNFLLLLAHRDPKSHAQRQEAPLFSPRIFVSVCSVGDWMLTG